MMQNMDAEDAMNMITAMRQQENTGYAVSSSLYMETPPKTSMFANPFASQRCTDGVDAACRAKMSEWCYQVADHCKFRRETVAIAMSCLDRFVQSPSGKRAQTDKSYFQKVAMTCLYTAIKIHEPEAMDPKIVSALSRGAYSEDDIIEMEALILQTLDWRMNPPTGATFMQLFMKLLPKNVVMESQRETILDLAVFQTELAVSDGWFIGSKASSIALAALGNAMQMPECLPSGYEECFTDTILRIAQIESNRRDILDMQDRMYLSIKACGGITQALNKTSTSPTTAVVQTAIKNTEGLSPRSTTGVMSM